jgi:hypothetical protein
MFVTQAEWLRAHRDELNIVYVAHMGDVSQNGDGDTDESEWINAADALYCLELPLGQFSEGLPYGVAVGNHDQIVPSGDTDPTTLYNQYFGKTHFAGMSYYGGSFDAKNNNQYQLFSASGFDLLQSTSNMRRAPLSWPGPTSF